MSDLTNQLLSLFGQNEISAISNQIGANENQTSEAIQHAVPTLLSAVQNNVGNGGASGLLSALDRDHDGSILDDVMGFFQNGGNNDGNGILKHLLGENKGNVENALASNNSSGISAGSIAKLLPLIAPVIMGFLGKQKQQNGVADEGGISSLIGQFIGGTNGGGLDIGNIISMFTGGGNANQGGAQTNTGGGIMDTISKLFGK
jgi:hypothetical protein